MTGKSLTIYAIDVEGNVYLWRHKIAKGYDVWARSIFPFIGIALGFFVGILWLLSSRFIGFMKKALADEFYLGENKNS